MKSEVEWLESPIRDLHIMHIYLVTLRHFFLGVEVGDSICHLVEVFTLSFWRNSAGEWRKIKATLTSDLQWLYRIIPNLFSVHLSISSSYSKIHLHVILSDYHQKAYFLGGIHFDITLLATLGPLLPLPLPHLSLRHPLLAATTRQAYLEHHILWATLHMWRKEKMISRSLYILPPWSC